MDDELDQIRPVEIRPRQVDHYKKILSILSREYGYMDTSPCGAGKTHLTFAVAATFGLSIVLIVSRR